MPPGKNPMSSTWAMEHKLDGILRARINLRGFEKIDGVQCDQKDKPAPVVNNITFRVMLVFIIMAEMWAEVLDVRGYS